MNEKEKTLKNYVENVISSMIMLFTGAGKQNMETKKLCLFVDDIRKLPDDTWQLARNISEAIRAINMFDFDIISLDHDIEGSRETFDVVGLFLAEKYRNKTTKPKIIIHTANPVGRQRFKNILDGFDITIKELGFK